MGASDRWQNRGSIRKMKYLMIKSLNWKIEKIIFSWHIRAFGLTPIYLLKCRAFFSWIRFYWPNIFNFLKFYHQWFVIENKYRRSFEFLFISEDFNWSILILVKLLSDEVLYKEWGPLQKQVKLLKSFWFFSSKASAYFLNQICFR